MRLHSNSIGKPVKTVQMGQFRGGRDNGTKERFTMQCILISFGSQSKYMYKQQICTPETYKCESMNNEEVGTQ